MFVTEDPLLTCILRFVTDVDQSDADNRRFLQQQLKALKIHLLQFPPQEQQQRAMEWVINHAKAYRAGWQQRNVSRESFELRCRDCPLAQLGASQHCEIHEQWLYLLRRYMSGEIQSSAYVEQALEMLREHKDSLLGRVPAPRQEPEDGRPIEKDPSKKKRKKKKKKPTSKAQSPQARGKV